MNEPLTTQPTAHTPIQVEWVGGMQFDAGRSEGPKIRIDGHAKAGPSPVDTLLVSIATCAATDVVEILQKQRTPAQSLSVRVAATRVVGTPRRLASVVLHFVIRGPGIAQVKADRAVELSVEKYCSVRSSLAGDVPVTWTVDLQS